MGVFKNFLNSEKAVASGVLAVGASVLAATGHMSVEQWMAYTQTVLGIYVGGKTLQGAASKYAEAKRATGESEALRESLSRNDAKADAAVDAKFGGGDNR